MSDEEKAAWDRRVVILIRGTPLVIFLDEPLTPVVIADNGAMRVTVIRVRGYAEQEAGT